MLRERFYYTLKPFLPWSVRMAFRRAAARRERARSGSVWPIDPASGSKPEGWPGWPESKKFAFVLTHDVEGPSGLANCGKLADLESEMGFRSCYNFVPEGSYRVSRDLRTRLTGQGFEVGVHDLEHNGKLYWSREDFQRKAVGINHYLREWRAEGFRSGFMLRNLEWIHDLDKRYDSSTFDTDPFEPQSDGAGTIYPYWIPAANGGSAPSDNGRTRGGYVELPYTLPQDSTLFLVLRETSPDIWKKKLDWIVQRGGMALVNVHPDYVRFEGDPQSERTYPVAHYREFLDYVKSRYAGQYWQALPKEVAAYVETMDPLPKLRRARRICMVTYSSYETDNRVTRYAESLAARGDQVDIFALRRSPDLPKEEVLAGVRVFRLQDRFKKSEQTKLSYLLPSLRFLFASSWWVTRRHARHPYDLVHVHNMPDFLVFAAAYPKLTGGKVILDIHDIVPELFGSKFGAPEKSTTFSLLKVMERISARFADHVIISNHLWLERYAARTGTGAKCSVFINNVDERIFSARPRTREDGKIIILFPGGLQWHQGLDIALHAFKKVRLAFPQAEFHIYGDGNMKPSLVALASKLGYNGSVRFFEPVRIKDIAQIMANADLGVVPKRADSFGNEAYSTKIMEFMSLGVPVVISRTKIDQYYFNDSVARFFESGNADALANAMIEVLQNGEARRRMIANASAYSDKNSWKTRQADYLALVDSMAPAG